MLAISAWVLVALFLGVFSQGIKLGPLADEHELDLLVTMPVRDQAGLDQFLSDLYDAKTIHFRQFLTPAQYTERFAPTAEDVQKVVQFLQSQSIEVTAVTPNNMHIHAKGNAKSTGAAFNTRLSLFLDDDDGKTVYYAPETEPVTPSGAFAVFGVQNRTKFSRSSSATKHRKHGKHGKHRKHPNPASLDVRNIRELYSMPSQYDGSGQVTGLLELDSYALSDIESYAYLTGIDNPPKLQNVWVGTAPYKPEGGGEVEVALDIELMMSTAPGLDKIVVYMGKNSDVSILMILNRMATDNLAMSISTSWATPEAGVSKSFADSENVAFQQLATQGQSFFAAAGDTGAFVVERKRSVLMVLDPASQPYVTGVGGTTVTQENGRYVKESSWWTPKARGYPASGGGGGISEIWPIPTYQVGLSNSANLGSNQSRNVPDVSLDANPETGYPIFAQGMPQLVGGTSCATPIWAAFFALVNQKIGKPVGFANPLIYGLGREKAGSIHDIDDGSTNGYYPAVIGYDLSTGWGSMNGTRFIELVN